MKILGLLVFIISCFLLSYPSRVFGGIDDTYPGGPLEVKQAKENKRVRELKTLETRYNLPLTNALPLGYQLTNPNLIGYAGFSTSPLSGLIVIPLRGSKGIAVVYDAEKVLVPGHEDKWVYVVSGVHGIVDLPTNPGGHEPGDRSGFGGRTQTNPTNPVPGDPPGSVYAYGMRMPTDFATTCSQIASVSSYLASPATFPDATMAGQLATTSAYLSGAYFSLSPWSSPGILQQSGSTPVQFTSVTSNVSYTLTGLYLNGSYVPKTYCVGDGATPTTWSANAGVSVSPNGIYSYMVAFTEPSGWFQTQGGNVYAKTYLTSGIAPAAVTAGTKFDSGNPPGILSSPIIDLTSDWATNGEDIVSSKNWYTQTTNADKDWYTMFQFRLNDATKSATLGNLQILGGGSKPAFVSGKEQNTYLYEGDLTITSGWSIGANEKYMILVTGNLTIDQPITFSSYDNSFLAFIVKGNITVTEDAGTTFSSTTPVLEGVYITNGTFTSSLSSALATEKLVVKGSVIAKDITMERSLANGNNSTYPAELFIFNPSFVFTQPKVFKDLPYTWQEVAP